jgi:NAD(P)-dependent dehydrogenase (short-subunit alcohol dehydrogenase family)
MTFGATSTADEVIHGVDLSGRIALVTGGGGGLGAETARALASAGALVVIAVRNLDQRERAAQELTRSVPAATVETLQLDLASLASVRAAAQEFLHRHGRLHLLINNAGVMATPFGRTVDGFELQFGTNHLGHFLLTNLLVPALVAGAPSRVVTVTSTGHHAGAPDFADPNYEKRDYEPWNAYGQSKSANILFTIELERRLARRGVHAYAVHPGVILTDLFRHLGPAATENVVVQAEKAAQRSGTAATKTVESGAATSVFAATSPGLEQRGGTYLIDCAVSDTAAPWATDPDAARRMWELSEKLVGQEFPTGSD